MKNLSQLIRKELQFNGVYKITNIKNNKIYIGSCSSKTFLYERLKHHEQDLINNKHCNKYLQRSFNKYGLENFYYEIIEVCNPEECIEKEQIWIDLLKPHYNLCKKAGSSFGRIVSEETSNKISKSNKLFWNNPINKSKMLKSFKKRPKPSKETIDKMKKSKEGYKHSNNTKNKIGKGNSKKIINLDTNEIYDSLLDASIKLNINYSYLSSLINKKMKIVKKIKNEEFIVYNLEWIKK